MFRKVFQATPGAARLFEPTTKLFYIVISLACFLHHRLETSRPSADPTRKLTKISATGNSQNLKIASIAN